MKAIECAASFHRMVIIATAAQMGESAGRNDWRVLRAAEGIAAAFESSSTCAWAGEQEHSIFSAMRNWFLMAV